MAFTSKLSLARERPRMVRPLSRKDIFYSGSVLNLPEYQSQKSLTNYRQSVISIPHPSRTEMGDVEKGDERKSSRFFLQKGDRNENLLLQNMTAVHVWCFRRVLSRRWRR